MIEVMISMVIITMAVLSVFSAAATTARVQAAPYVQSAAESSVSSLSRALAQYVSADRSDPASGPQGSWALPGDPCAHALATSCAHDATSAYLSPAVLAVHPDARLTYAVQPGPGPDTLAVDFTVAWR